MSRLLSLYLRMENFDPYFNLRTSAFIWDFDDCAKRLKSLLARNYDRNEILRFVDILRKEFYSHVDSSSKKYFKIIAFQHCCHLLFTNFHIPLTFLKTMSRLYLRNILQAQKRLYFWWIAICYDTRLECGKRMAEKSWQNFLLIQ